MSEKYETMAEAYDEYRTGIKDLRRSAKDRAQAHYAERLADLQTAQKNLERTLFEDESLSMKTSLANRAVRLLNEGMTKTELLRAIRTNTWSRCVEMLSYASATVEQKERAPVRPAGGLLWGTVEDGRRVVTVFSNWRSKKALLPELVPVEGLRFVEGLDGGEPVPDYPFVDPENDNAMNPVFKGAERFYRANLWAVRELFGWDND